MSMAMVATEVPGLSGTSLSTPNGQVAVHDPWYRTIAAKLKVAGQQVSRFVVRFVTWAKNAIVSIFGSTGALASVGAAIVLATKRGYHAVVNVLEHMAKGAMKVLSYVGKAIGWVADKVTSGISWLLHKISGRAGDWFDGAVLTAKIAWAKVTSKATEAVDAGFNALSSKQSRQIVGATTAVGAAAVVANTVTNGALAATTVGTFVSSAIAFTPLGLLTIVGSLLFGIFAGGAVRNLISGYHAEPEMAIIDVVPAKAQAA